LGLQVRGLSKVFSRSAVRETVKPLFSSLPAGTLSIPGAPTLLLHPILPLALRHDT